MTKTDKAFQSEGNFWIDCAKYIKNCVPYFSCKECFKNKKSSKTNEAVNNDMVYSCGESDTEF